MKFIVLGANGQLGSELKEKAQHYSEHHFLFSDIEEVDITKASDIEEYIQNNPCDVVINAAAYTAVDKAETEKEKALAINVSAVNNLALLSKKYRFFLIHISTDYVFDGKAYLPYKENDTTHPLSVYGKTKLQGESALQNTLTRGAIVRTSWLYSSYGNNFLKTIMRLSKERSLINVVFDQIGTPTYAADLAEAVLTIGIQNHLVKNLEIYHYSNEGVASWYDFAHEILRLTQSQTTIIPIESKDFPTPAKRPFYSVLNKSKIKKDFNITIPHWKESLILCLNKLTTKD